MTSAVDMTPLAGLEGRWTLQVLVLLCRAAERFSDLRSALPGVSANVLTVRLRELEDSGLVHRTYQPPNGARALYELGANARRLKPLLHGLDAWTTEASRLPQRSQQGNDEINGAEDMRYFEDVAVGETARFGEYRVTREDVIAFAERYDPQPFHLSDEAAAKTPFMHLAASGWHTCAMTMAMIVAHKAETGEALLGSPGIDTLRWLAPVYPGDTLRCESVVTEARRSESRPTMGLTKTSLTVLNQSDTPVMSYVANMMIQARPAA